jgi:uncharacterized membrane protein
VLAIIITIMVLELPVPHDAGWQALRPVLPVFGSYALSFVFLGIYWSNHHHLFQVVRHVNGPVLWANLHLLFWLSLIPFATAWMGDSHFAREPVALYGVVLILAASAYYVLTRILLRAHGTDSTLAAALGNDVKGKASIGIYLAAVAVSLRTPWLAAVLYVAVALMWLVPDPRMEKALVARRE